MATPGGSAAIAPARFYGLSQGQVSSFTSSPDGSVVSLLFDDFCAPPTVPSKAALIPTRTFTIVSSPTAAGQGIDFDIRGAVVNAAGAKIRFKVGDQQFDFEPNEESFSVQARAPVSRNDAYTRVEILLELPASGAAGPTEGLLTVDSIDVSLDQALSPVERG